MRKKKLKLSLAIQKQNNLTPHFDARIQCSDKLTLCTSLLFKKPDILLSDIMDRPMTKQNFIAECNNENNLINTKPIILTPENTDAIEPEHCIPKIMLPKHKKLISNFNETATALSITVDGIKSDSYINLHNMPKNTKVIHTFKNVDKKIEVLQSQSDHKPVLNKTLIEKHGYLWRKKAHKSWKKSYCVIMNKEFIWTKSKENKKVQGFIQFDFDHGTFQLLHLENKHGFVYLFINILE